MSDEPFIYFNDHQLFCMPSVMQMMHLTVGQHFVEIDKVYEIIRNNAAVIEAINDFYSFDKLN